MRSLWGKSRRVDVSTGLWQYITVGVDDYLSKELGVKGIKWTRRSGGFNVAYGLIVLGIEIWFTPSRRRRGI